jgi:hypothetical protein
MEIRPHLAVGMAKRIVGAVDDEPPCRGRDAVERHPHQPAGDAAAAVAADDVARVNGMLPIPEVDSDAVRGFDAVLHPMPEPDFDVVEALEPAEQFGVDHRLNEPVALGPAESGVGRRHFGEQSTLGVEEPQDLVRHGVRQDTVDQADRLESPQRLVVQTDTAWIVDEGVTLLHDEGPNALQAKDVRQCQAGGPGPDDDDIRFDAHRYRPIRKSRCNALNVLGSSYWGQCPQPGMTSNRAPGIIDAMRRPSAMSAVGSSLVHITNVGAVIDPYSAGPSRLRARISGSCSAIMSFIAPAKPGWR